MSDERKKKNTILNVYGRKYAESPLPAWFSSLALLSLLPSTSASTSPTLRSHLPRRWTLLAFPAIFAVSGFMTYDNAIVDGAGTTAAWSVLYFIVNGARRTVKPVLTVGRVGLGPTAAAGLVGVNAVTHGWVYFTAKRED
ncbi:hypothetical protein RUND412_003652 [Rhizina undulata]